MATEISIGSVAAARMQTSACFAGELGVCYGASEIEGKRVYGFIFETGRFIVLADEDVLQFLRLLNRVCEAVRDYSYTGDAQLMADFRAGRFREAFPSLKR